MCNGTSKGRFFFTPRLFRGFCDAREGFFRLDALLRLEGRVVSPTAMLGDSLDVVRRVGRRDVLLLLGAGASLCCCAMSPLPRNQTGWSCVEMFYHGTFVGFCVCIWGRVNYRASALLAGSCLHVCLCSFHQSLWPSLCSPSSP